MRWLIDVWFRTGPKLTLIVEAADEREAVAWFAPVSPFQFLHPVTGNIWVVMATADIMYLTVNKLP